MRKIVARAFSPGAVRELASQVVTLAHEIVDTVIEDGECDLATQIAAPLPVGWSASCSACRDRIGSGSATGR
jgi:cytochrome P450